MNAVETQEICLDTDNASIILFMVFALHDAKFSRVMVNKNSVTLDKQQGPTV